MVKYIIIIMIYDCYSYHLEKRTTAKKIFHFSFRFAISQTYTHLEFPSVENCCRSENRKIYHFYFQFHVEFMVE